MTLVASLINTFSLMTLMLRGITRTANAFSSPVPSPPSSSFESSSSCGFVFGVDQFTPITSGTLTLPPMVSVPCSFVSLSAASSFDNNKNIDKSNIKPKTSFLPKEIIQPPNVETLYDWYANVQNKPDADPSWAVLWPTAVALANYIVANSNSLVKGKTVVELGCGLGFAGLTAACLGAKSVLLTDREPFALHCAMSTVAVHNNNINLTDKGSGNGSGSDSVAIDVRSAVLDWNKIDAEILSDYQNDTDIILASDVLYDPSSIKAFAKMCKTLAISSSSLLSTTHRRRTKALVADPQVERVPGARQMLQAALSVPLVNDNGDSCREDSKDCILKRLDEITLGAPALKTITAAITATTVDGKDHERRMQESSVLLCFEL